METKISNHKPVPCPYCGNRNDQATKALINRQGEKVYDELREAEPGAVNLCMHCGNPSVFDQNLKLRIMTQEEIKQLKKDDPEGIILLKKAQMTICSTMIKSYLYKQGISMPQ